MAGAPTASMARQWLGEGPHPPPRQQSVLGAAGLAIATTSVTDSFQESLLTMKGEDLASFQ